MTCGNYWLKKSLNDELHEYADQEIERRSLWFQGCGLNRGKVPSITDVFKAEVNLGQRVRLDVMTFGKNQTAFTVDVEVVESPLKSGVKSLQRGDGILKLRINGSKISPRVWKFLNVRSEKTTALLWFEALELQCSGKRSWGTWKPMEIHTLQNARVQSYRTTNFPADDCVEIWLKHDGLRGNVWPK